jgi:hypothetical protein
MDENVNIHFQVLKIYLEFFLLIFQFNLELSDRVIVTFEMTCLNTLDFIHKH